MKTKSFFRSIKFLGGLMLVALFFYGCQDTNNSNNAGASLVGSKDIASKVYVPPGKYDEFYAFISGGFSGQISVYGLPSGRLLE